MEQPEIQTEPLFPARRLRRLLIPLIIEQLLAMTVGMADTVMITSVGEAAVSGVSLVDQVSNLVIFILAALCTGGAVVVSQYLGRQEPGNARTAAKQLLYTVTGLALLVSLLLLPFRAGLLRLLFGAIEPAVMENALIYFTISACSYPFLAIYNSIAALFRSMGNSRVSMLTSLIMNLVNIGGNAILIFGYGWGAAGAATATLTSRVLAAVIMLILIHNPHRTIFLHKLLRFEFRPEMVKTILRIGIPNGFENGLFHLGRLMLQSLISSFGTASIAANAIMGSIHSVVTVPGAAIGLGLITVVGQCMGAGETEQAARYTRLLMKLIYLCMLPLSIAMFLFSAPLLRMFNLSAEAVAIGEGIMRTLSVFGLFVWPVSFPFANALRAAGDTRYTMVVSIVSMAFVRIGLGVVMSLLFGLALRGIWYAMFIDWIVRSACFLLRYRSGKWKGIKVI